ncbi:MAG: carbohydrate ABC transporter permease [Alphaproteobacteria bacterium]
MSDTHQNGGGRSLWQRLFEPPAIGRAAPGSRIIVYTLLIGWTIFVLFPIYWLVITSFKTRTDYINGPFFLPFVDFQPSLHAWTDLLVTDWKDTIGAYVNSLVIAPASTVLSVIVGSMAAYALARIEYKPKFGSIVLFVLLTAAAVVVADYALLDWWVAFAIAMALFFFLLKAVGRHFRRRLSNGDILFWIISQRILAPIVVIVPIYLMFKELGLIDNHIALILAYCVINLPIVVWLMYDFFNSIPIDLEESAQLDGASRVRTFWEVVLPLSRPGLAATALLVLILAWNEYLLAVFLSTTHAQTMPILVAAMNAGEKGILWWSMSVVIIVMIIPVVLLALVLQRFISKGVLLGAVKG